MRTQKVPLEKITRISTGGMPPRRQLASKPARRSMVNRPPSSDEENSESESSADEELGISRRANRSSSPEETRGRISTGGSSRLIQLASKGPRRISSDSSADKEMQTGGRRSTGGSSRLITLASKGPREISRSPSPPFSIIRYRPGLETQRWYIRNYRKTPYRRSGDISLNHINDIKLARRIRGDYNYFYL